MTPSTPQTLPEPPSLKIVAWMYEGADGCLDSFIDSPPETMKLTAAKSKSVEPLVKLSDVRAALSQPMGVAGIPEPQLLTAEETKSLQECAEIVWDDLQKNELGGYSGINRPFYLAWMFKTVIERYGYRDVGLKHSKDALDEAFERGRKSVTAAASPPPAPPRVPLTDDFNGDDAALCRSIEALLALDAAKALGPHGVGGHARSLLSAAAARLSEAAK